MPVSITGHAQEGSIDRTVVFDIPQQRADLALTEFAEQADLTMVFPDELVRDREANQLIGAYTLQEGIDRLLDGTGLSPTFSNEVVLSISADDPSAGEGDTMKTSKKAGLVAVLAGVFGADINAQEASAPEQTIQTSVVTGKVTDARTGANLKGALVRIEETGQSTSTNDLGEFRFVNVPTGSVTLTVSYLGYAGQASVVDVRGDGTSQSFALRGGSEIEEIVVFGQRSARALALNQERTAANFTTVISSDMLGQFNGATISEVLKAAPGVAFVPDDTTGEGSQIIVRGLAPDLNQVTLNGVRISEGTGRGRSPDLGNILAESIESVTINKTLLPSQDSNGAGALIEIETKSPLSRPKRFANFGVEYTGKGNDFGDSYIASGTISGQFGSNDDFGASLSYQRREQNIDNINYQLGLNFGQYLPAGIAASFQIDPREIRSFPFEPEADEVYPSFASAVSSAVESENDSLTLSLEKLAFGNSRFRLDITNSTETTLVFSNETRASFSSGYVLVPVEELGGEERFAYVSEDISAFSQGVRGSVLRFARQAETEQTTTTFAFRGDTELDRWGFNYSAGYSRGESNTPFARSLSLGNTRGFSVTDLSVFSDEVLANRVGSTAGSVGRLVSPWLPVQPGQRGFAYPDFSDFGYEFYNDIDNVPLSSADEVTGREGSNSRFNLGASSRYSFASQNVLDYVEIGAFYEDSEFDFLLGPKRRSYSSSAMDLTELGLRFGPGVLTRVGFENDFSGLSQNSVSQFYASRGALIGQGLLSESVTETDPDVNRTFNIEEELSLYVESKADFGNLEVIGGVRATQVDIDTAFFSGPILFDSSGAFVPGYREQFGQVLSGRASQTDILPRVLANYRLNDDMIFRGGFFTTRSRPNVSQLTSRTTPILNLQPIFGDGSQVSLRLQRGNPDLSPAETQNFDLSWEWYTDNFGVIKLSGFYKRTENLIELNNTGAQENIRLADLELPDTDEFNSLTDEGTSFSVTQPQNADDVAKVWGLEASIERQFTKLPGWWSGFGIYGNITYSDSSRDRQLNFSDPVEGAIVITVEDAQFDNSPDYTGTASLTYSNFGIDANLTYTYQAERMDTFTSFGLGTSNDEFDQLDFRLQYLGELGDTQFRIFFAANDLLRDEDETFNDRFQGGVAGTSKYYTGGSYLGGRNFTIGGSVTF